MVRICSSNLPMIYLVLVHICISVLTRIDCVCVCICICIYLHLLGLACIIWDDHLQKKRLKEIKDEGGGRLKDGE